MLHFIGFTSFGAPLPDAVKMLAAGRRLGGPDFEPVAIWRGPECIFASRRMALRATGSAGPAIARDGAIRLIGSGRIDARDALISALGRDPARPANDAELMLATLERWGEAGVDQLMGSFAFAAWDCVERRLTLAKDWSGSMPLFYHRGDGFVVFGTNPAALLALGLFPGDLDDATLAENLTSRSSDPEATLYRHLKRVRCGGTAAFDPAGARTSIFWRPQRGPQLKLKDDAAYVEATRSMLAEVMRDAFPASRPVGVMLSGGFDSGAVAATLALLAPDREIHGFTLVPTAGDPAYRRGMGREWAHVQALARLHPNLRVHAIGEKKLTPLDDAHRDFFSATGLPLTSPNLMARRLALAEAARAQGVGVLFNGDGGNRTLTAEGEELFRDLALSGRWVQLAREIVASARFERKPLGQVLWRDALRDMAPRGLLEIYLKFFNLEPPPYTTNSFLRPTFAHSSGLLAKWRAAPNFAGRMMRLHREEFKPTRLAIQPSHIDAYTLAYHRLGMEFQSPLRDRRLIDFVLSLPYDQFRRNGVTRFLARGVLADRMPAATLAERGFFEPFSDSEHWLAGWWEKAARQIEDQRPTALSAAAIDLPALRAELAKGPPQRLPPYGRERDLIGSNLAVALHINQFIRWHQGLND